MTRPAGRAARRDSVYRLADDVLAATVAGDQRAVVALYIAWRDEWGQPKQQDLAWLACCWADTAVEALLGPGGAGEPVELKFISDTGQVHAADEVPPAAAWAGRFIAARIARDEPQQQALFGALSAMPTSFALRHVEAVLEAAVRTVPGTPRRARLG